MAGKQQDGLSALLEAVAQAPSVEPGLASDTLVGRYRIEDRIGRGGMGVVYRAHDTVLGRTVALKAMLVDDPARRARFLREARAAAALNHPHVVTVFDVVEHEERLCVVMELLEGKTLRAYVGGDVPIETRLGWLREVAGALDAAHRAGLVHRDVKPENIVITNDGVAKVLDFGLVRAVGRTEAHASATQLTQEGVAIGTPGYMAPEQIGGEAVDGRTDQFAWGVVAYELLTGRRPWSVAEDATASAVFAAILTEEPKLLDRPGVPPRVAGVVARALAKKKAARFASMAEIRAALAPEAEPGRPSERNVAAPTPDPTATGPGVDVPLRIDRAPLPESDKPDALEAYADALRSFRDGNWPAAFDALVRATAIDPNLAAAHLRTAIVGRTGNHLFQEEVRAVFRRALSLRHRLAPRDVALLRAYEPIVLEEPADVREAHRRFARLTETRPLDAELLVLAATVHGLDGAAPERVREWAERALAIDPEYADAWQAMADGTYDDDEARAAFARSVDICPAAADAWIHLAVLDAQRGDVRATEQNARRCITAGAPAGGDLLAGALFARGADARAIVDALARAAAAASEPRRPSLLARAEVSIAVLEGDFDRADEHLARWYELLRDQEHNELHSLWVASKLLLLRERGDREGCARIADAYLVGRETRTMANRPARDETALCLAMRAAVANAAERRKIAAQRRSWLEGSIDGASALGWGLAYGFLLEDAQDEETVAEARAACPSREGLLFRRSPMLRFDQGLALRHIGETARARDCLERAARTLMAPLQPFRSTLAHLHLGEVLEAEGDRAGAAAAFRVVVDRWGKASSVSAERARRGLARLGMVGDR